MEVIINDSILRLKIGDITKEKVDVIVNAANSRLAGGGGVDGAIHRAGGPEIMKECRKYPGCLTGQAVITTAGKLNARYVIHAVGPYYTGKAKDAELLAGAYRESLRLGSKYSARTVSFPAISTGAYRYPLKEAAEVALSTVIDYIKEKSDIEEVRFVLFDQKTYDVYVRILEKLK